MCPMGGECAPWGASVPHGGASVPHEGRNYRLMALCHIGALMHSKTNAMFIKHFKP